MLTPLGEGWSNTPSPQLAPGILSPRLLLGGAQVWRGLTLTRTSNWALEHVWQGTLQPLKTPWGIKLFGGGWHVSPAGS